MSAKKKNIIKRINLLFILGVLLIPLSQEFFYFFKIKPLVGFFEQAPKPTFSFEKWIDGTFQTEKEKFIDQHYGTRDFLVRLNNQFDFWLFNKTHANNVVCGKQGMLYERQYITSYQGKDYLGQEKINDITNKLKAIQDVLKTKNKTIIIVLAPGKGSFFPEYFPEYLKTAKQRNNHDEFTKQLSEKNICTIDFLTWFTQNKGKTPYPLFTELGVHWTLYGSSLAFDSITKYVERQRNIDIPEYIVNRYETPDTLRPPDDDIFKATNMLFDMPHAKTAYPLIEVRSGPGKTQPTLLTIGDSFWWNIYNTAVCTSVFKNGRFWYYNNDAYPETFTNQTKVKDLDFDKAIAETDVIILCYTECNLSTIGNGFIEKLYDSLFDKKEVSSTEKNEKIKNLMDYIRNDKVWMELIKVRSTKENIPVDSLIFYDARWQVENNP